MPALYEVLFQLSVPSPSIYPEAVPAIPQICIVIHIALMRAYLEVMTNIKRLLQTGGLYGKGIRLLLGSCGPLHKRTAIEKLFDDHDDWQWIAHDDDVNIYERLTLHAMRDYAIHHASSSTLFLYMHSKGVSRPLANSPSRGSLGWTNYMGYFLCQYSPVAISLLHSSTDIDAVGVQVHPWRSQLHFSGNFWWTTGRYLSQLPVPIGPAYLDPEMWIGRTRGRLHSLFHLTPYQCLHTHFDPRRYVNHSLNDTNPSPIILDRWPETSWYGVGESWVSVPSSPPSQRNFHVSTMIILGATATDPCPNTLKMWIMVVSNQFMTIMEHHEVVIRDSVSVESIGC